MSYFNPTDELSNVFNIVFENITVKQSVQFKAFITNWNDEFKQDWNPISTFGRMDDIRIYKRTSRKLNFDIEIPSASEQEAEENFSNIQKLIQMGYPTFETKPIGAPSNSDSSIPSGPQSGMDASALSTIGSANQANSNSNKISIMGSPPFMNIKFANWAVQAGNSYGLYGTIDSVKFNPLFGNEGGFYSTNLTQDSGYAPLTPKLLKLSISFNVIHVENLGYGMIEEKILKEDGTLKEVKKHIGPRQSQFPYRAEEVYAKKKPAFRDELFKNLMNSFDETKK